MGTSKTFLFIHQVDDSVRNIKTVTCCVRHMTRSNQYISLCFLTDHVCAVGSVLCVGAAMIWKEGQRVLNPPGGS